MARAVAYTALGAYVVALAVVFAHEMNQWLGPIIRGLR